MRSAHPNALWLWPRSVTLGVVLVVSLLGCDDRREVAAVPNETQAVEKVAQAPSTGPNSGAPTVETPAQVTTAARTPEPQLATARVAPTPISSSQQPVALAMANPTNDIAAKENLDAPGIRVLLFPSRETTLVAQMVGKITSVPDTVGAMVKEGAAVVQFDCDELRARVEMAQAEFNAAKESHEAKIRLQGLQSAGEVEVALAAAAREKARAAVDLSKVQMRACSVVAPFGGRVVKLHVKRYQGVNVGAPLVDIVAAGQPRMRLNVPSKWLSWLKVGTKFSVDIDETARSYPARVVALNARVDAVSQSIEIEAEALGKHTELLPGMSGTAKFEVPVAMTQP